MQDIDINKATQPYEYYLKFIKENCRPDNRRLSDIRPCNVTVNCINTANGSSLVKLGSTNVICGINARLCRPKEDRPNKGYIICNVEVPALCSSKNFKSSSSAQSGGFTQSSVSSASIEQTQAMLTQLMQDIIAESKCLNEEDLCIKEGKLAWILYIDLICLNNDGNVQDACCLAMISALKNLKLYEVDFDEEENKPIVKYPLILKSLVLNNEPVCTSLFALEENILLTDPNKQEEDFMKTFVLICSIDTKKICLIRKLGGFSLKTEQLNLCINRALENGKYLRENVYNKF
ncbi:unnamed protein product [Brachionus calyciflorus]|uniref:Ribosomal RNA-processing protein 43 n=1 Tax=Brachionus calyciflorus TaxID=104777 RepID=A0A813VGI8_9BILA|nr:unnamed protein product [Brachionus calyciflorus]